MQKDLFGQPVHNPARNMSDFFIVPPFSILDTMDGAWQRRKKRWDKLIGDEGQARAGALHSGAESIGWNSDIGDVSLLDATLAEVITRWFTEPGHFCFDPFAGDTVFGFVSAYLGRMFRGIELRPEQVKFNQAACDRENLDAGYFCGDSSEVMDIFFRDESIDFLFSCPPYADLEVYSDLPADLSTMPHAQFFQVYEKILTNTFRKLRNNRFACIVVGDVRDKKTGAYIQLPGKTVDIMVRAGYKFYNEIILVNSVGSLPMRAGKQMNTGRKVGKRHQNVLVFLKGEHQEIRNHFSELIPKNEFYESGDLQRAAMGGGNEPGNIEGETMQDVIG